MKRNAVIVGVLLGCGLGAPLTLVVSGSQGTRVHSAASVHKELWAEPAVWQGRTLLVGGRFVPCAARGLGDCPPRTWRPLLVDPANGSAVAVTRQPPTGTAALLRGDQLLEDMIPGVQQPRRGAEGTNRLRPLVGTDRPCPPPPCAEAVMPDTALDPPPERPQ